jgi:predicted small secreted protein
MTSKTRPSATAPAFDARQFTYGSIAAVLLAAALLSGCNTAKGIGDDVENAADKVEDAVD